MAHPAETLVTVNGDMSHKINTCIKRTLWLNLDRRSWRIVMKKLCLTVLMVGFLIPSASAAPKTLYLGRNLVANQFG